MQPKNGKIWLCGYFSYNRLGEHPKLKPHWIIINHKSFNSCWDGDKKDWAGWYRREASINHQSMHPYVKIETVYYVLGKQQGNKKHNWEPNRTFLSGFSIWLSITRTRYYLYCMNENTNNTKIKVNIDIGDYCPLKIGYLIVIAQ
jgi:hypothetical protein